MAITISPVPKFSFRSSDPVRGTSLEIFLNHLPASQKLKNIISKKYFLVYAFSFFKRIINDDSNSNVSLLNETSVHLIMY